MTAERLEQGPSARATPDRDDRDLLRLPCVEIEHGKKIRVRKGVLFHAVSVKPQHPLPLVEIFRLFGNRVKTEAKHGRQRVPGWYRTVVHGLRAGDQLLVLLAGVEEAAVLSVPEIAKHALCQPFRPLEMPAIERRFEKVEERKTERRVVVEKAG